MGFISAAVFFGAGYYCARPNVTRIAATGVVRASVPEVYNFFKDPAQRPLTPWRCGNKHRHHHHRNAEWQRYHMDKYAAAPEIISQTEDRLIYRVKPQCGWASWGSGQGTTVVTDFNDKAKEMLLSYPAFGSNIDLLVKFEEIAPNKTRVDVTGTANGTWLSNKFARHSEKNLYGSIRRADAVLSGEEEAAAAAAGRDTYEYNGRDWSIKVDRRLRDDWERRKKSATKSDEEH